MKYSIWKRGLFVLVSTFVLGTGVAFAIQASERPEIEREHPHPPEPAPDAGPPPQRPCGS